MFTFIFGTLFYLLMLGSLALIIFGLPGTWLIIVLNGFYALLSGGDAFTWEFFIWLLGLAVFGEIAEFFLGHYGAKRFGGSNKGSFAGIIGAIVGSIFGAPFFFGVGALFGALFGAFVACTLVELMSGLEFSKAAHAGFGTALGRFGGFVVKIGVGVTMLVMSWPVIFN